MPLLTKHGTQGNVKKVLDNFFTTELMTREIVQPLEDGTIVNSGEVILAENEDVGAKGIGELPAGDSANKSSLKDNFIMWSDHGDAVYDKDVIGVDGGELVCLVEAQENKVSLECGLRGGDHAQHPHAVSL